MQTFTLISDLTILLINSIFAVILAIKYSVFIAYRTLCKYKVLHLQNPDSSLCVSGYSVQRGTSGGTGIAYYASRLPGEEGQGTGEAILLVNPSNRSP